MVWDQARLASSTLKWGELNRELTWPDTVHGSTSEGWLGLYLNPGTLGSKCSAASPGWRRLARHVTLASALNPEFWDLLKIRRAQKWELIAWGDRWSIHVGEKKKKNSMHARGIRFPHFQTYDRATVYHFYLKIYLETGAPPLAELPGSEGALGLLSL